MTAAQSSRDLGDAARTRRRARSPGSCGRGRSRRRGWRTDAAASSTSMPCRISVQVAGVLLDLRELDRAERVLDRQRVEVKDVGSRRQSRRSAAGPGPPRANGRTLVEPTAASHCRSGPGATVIERQDGDHCVALRGRLRLVFDPSSPPLADSAACAAARRATGTRYGEQLT